MRRKKTAAIALLTVLILVVSLMPLNAFAVYRTSVGDAETPAKYKDGFVQRNCLDISSWNGDLDNDDWEAIKDAGVDSVIIRAGYSKLNTNRLKKDDCFKQNIKRARKHGLDVGVYYFTTALTHKEMEREAKFFMKIIEPYRSMITLPVALDFETNSGGRLNSYTLRELGQKNCTELCMTFCDIIADNGYEPMLYASRALFNYYLDAEKLEDKYAIWIAQYTYDLSATGYPGEYYMWQYSSNVRIPGIRGRFDGNYLYEKDYTAKHKPKEIKSSKGKTVTYKLSAPVKSVLPVKSNTKKAKAQVTDSLGVGHDYTIWKSAATDQSSDECIIAGLLSGLGYENEKGELLNPAAVRKFLTGSKDKKADLDDLEDYMDAFDKLGVIGDMHDDEDNVYVDIKGNLAGGMPVILSIDADSGPWKGDSQRLLLIGMDEDGRAIVADSKDRKWFETDQRFKLTDIDELVSYIDDGYIIIRGAH